MKRRFLLPAAAGIAVMNLLAMGAPAHALNTGDDYPYKDTTQYPDGQLDPWSFNYRECVSFVAHRLHQSPINEDDFQNQMTRNGNSATWGDAKNWDEVAVQLGYGVGSVPAVGAVAQWNANESSKYVKTTKLPNGGTQTTTFTTTASDTGHVAIVEKVNSDGSVLIDQYNANVKHAYSSDTVKAPRYIYIGVAQPQDTGVNPAIKLSQSSAKGVVTLTLKSYPASAGKTAYFFRRSGMTGQVVPYGTAVIKNDGTAKRTFNAKSGQILAIYSKDTGVPGPTSPYSNTISFKVN